MSEPKLWTRTGIAGVVGTICYVLAVVIPWPETQFGTSMTLLVISAWPILSIIYAYGLYHYIAAERESMSNRLAFVFTALAFATVLAMIIVQLAVGAGSPEYTRNLDDATGKSLTSGLRMIDLGLDVAWDMLIGVGLILSGTAMAHRRGLGRGWGVPSILFGAALIGLNAATFPTPPANAGLFDIGPFIAMFIIALAIRLTSLGLRHAGPRG